MVRIRLARTGRRNRPIYRIVVADSRSKRDGKVIDRIGVYDPISKELSVDCEKYNHWLSKGAHPSDRVRKLCAGCRKAATVLREEERTTYTDASSIQDPGLTVLPPLYKYLDVSGAKLTLGNRTFKHAKPSDFNDTEDLTIQSVFTEDTEQALKKPVVGFKDVILQHIDDPPTCSSPTKEKVTLIQRIYRTNPETANIARVAKLEGGSEPIFDVEQMRALAQAFLTEVNEFMQDYRVLCVTTHRDSEKMWVDYAENHRGIALRIVPNSAKDSKFQLFRPVTYRENRPPLFDSALEFLAQRLFGDQEAHSNASLDNIIYTKTLDLEHEDEYRLAVWMGENEEPWNTMLYHPEEITELYLGLAMEKSDMEEIVAMARAINPDIAIFRAKRDGGEIVFDGV